MLPVSSPDAHPSSAPRPVIICGLGHVGCRVASLYCRLGAHGAIITREIGEHWHRNATDAFEVITGNAREEALLLAAGVREASVLLALTNDDVANVDICLEARRLNPAITVIARILDEDLANHLERSGIVHRAFCTASLAVPAFTAAARSSSIVDSLDLAGVPHDLERIVVDAANLTSPGPTLGEWEKQTGARVFAVQRPGAAARRPDPAQPLEQGLLLHTLTPRSRTKSTVKSPLRHSLHRFQLGLLHSWSEVPSAFRIALAILAVVFLASVVVFHLSLGLSWIDSLYFVCTTITTVGYGDINLQQAPSWLKLYGSFLMLCSAGLLATVCSIITNLLLQTRLRDLLARGCSDQRGHLVVVGLGNVGYRLVSALVASGEKVVAIENNREGRYVEATKHLAPVIHGDARIPSTLREAGIDGAKVLVAVTSHDVENLAIGLSAKRLAPSGRIVLRLFDAKFAESMGKGSHLDALLSVSTVAAPNLIAAALRRDAIKGIVLDDLLVIFYPTGDGSLGIEWHTLAPAHPRHAS